MNDLVYIVSRFQSNLNGNNVFHFIGYFNGVRINKIVVDGGSFEKNEDYVLAINQVNCKNGILYGNLIKSKKLFI